jgi:alpha-D-xyloside xylohydrolase
MGFCGQLWTPELRNATNEEDLIRRLQSVAMSPLALINAWYIKNPPWKQVAREANNQDKLTPNWEAAETQCRAVMELRMKLVPYLHAAFVRYHRTGFAPFRALVMDYPDDPQTWSVDNQYLMGESLLVAPAFAGESSRAVYLPEGQWFDYWTGKEYNGKQRIQLQAPLDQIPLFVKSGTILPLAKATLHTNDPASFQLTALVYGTKPNPTLLFEEDGSATPKMAQVSLEWNQSTRSGSLQRTGSTTGSQYEVVEWRPA